MTLSLIVAIARNNHDMLSIIHDKLQPLGLQRSETIISFHEAISRQIPIPNIFGDANEEATAEDELDDID